MFLLSFGLSNPNIHLKLRQDMQIGGVTYTHQFLQCTWVLSPLSHLPLSSILINPAHSGKVDTSILLFFLQDEILPDSNMETGVREVGRN